MNKANTPSKRGMIIMELDELMELQKTKLSKEIDSFLSSLQQ
jgi:hypothetical protein